MVDDTLDVSISNSCRHVTVSAPGYRYRAVFVIGPYSCIVHNSLTLAHVRKKVRPEKESDREGLISGWYR